MPTGRCLDASEKTTLFTDTAFPSIFQGLLSIVQPWAPCNSWLFVTYRSHVDTCGIS